MLKDKKLLPKLIKGVKDNNLESLELLHFHFEAFINKYAYKYGVDISTLNAEFDFILVYIINKEITDPLKILGYLNICFKHFKNFNIDKLFRYNENFKIENIEDFENILFASINIEEESNKLSFPNISNVISEEMIEILQEKFIDKLTCETIGRKNNLSKQRISQKILKSKKILKSS